MSSSVEAIKPKNRFTWTPEERTEWVELFRGSRQSVSQFCRDTGLPPATLSLWLNQQALSEARDACQSEFVEVTLPALPAPMPAAAAAAGPAVTVHLPNGARVEVSASTEASWVGQLVRSLLS